MEAPASVCFQLQEHFKATKSLKQYFKKYFKSFDNFPIPAIRETLSHAGRPKGGLVQLVKNEWNIKKKKIVSKSWRVQGQILVINDYKLLWMNVYMPTDPRLQQFDETEILETLADIESIIFNSVFDDIIIGGDWNFDPRRNTRFCRILKEFFDKNELKSIWTKFPTEFTYRHTDLKSISLIDHFFVNESFLERCIDAAPLHLGDNRSNHSPIMLKVDIPKVVKKENHGGITISRPSWSKADYEDKEAYANILDQKLSELCLPSTLDCDKVDCCNEQHSIDRDSYVLDVLFKVIETSFECIPVTNKLSDSQKTKVEKLNGWKENVLPLKNDSLFWHSIWLSLGKPSSGGVFNVMKHTRNKYHYAVRKAKRETDRLKSQALAEAAASNNLALFKEMKKCLYNKKCAQDVPDELEGETVFDGILEKFRECYEELYNSSDTSDEMLQIKIELNQKIKSCRVSSKLEALKISPSVIKDAVKLMKPNKSDVSGFFTSDVFINAPDSLYIHLAAIFRSFVIHGTIAKEILSCAFLPLYKGGLKDPTKFKSYRAIAGASQLLKLFEYVVLKLWGHCFTTDSLQFGFKPGLSTTQCSWLIQEVAQWYIQRGGVCQAAFMDCSMAFDRCLYSKLFSKMIAKDVPPIIVRVLIFAYEEQKGWVRLSGKNSSTFSIRNATRQGSVLSPYFFSSCYLDDLLVKLRELQLGCHVSGVWVGATAYADDLTLLAPDRSILQKMVNVCENYGKEHNLMFSTDPNPNKSKTKCVYFSPKRRNVVYPPPIILDGEELPWVNKVDHLGHILQENLNMEADASRAKTSFMCRANDMRDSLYFAHPEQRIKAIQLYCCDAYGSMLWLLSSRYSDSYFKAWNVQARLAWNIPRETHTNLVENFFCNGFMSLRNQVLSRYHKFVLKLSESPSKEVRFLVNLVKFDKRSITGLNVAYVSDLCKFNVMRLANWRVKKLLPKASRIEPWRSGLLSSLLSCRWDRSWSQLNLDRTQCEEMISSLCIS